jgi:hypothetical protein
MVVLVLFAGGFAGILGSLAWLSRHARRSGIGTWLLRPIDEIYNPGRRRSPAEPPDRFKPGD